MTEKKIDYKNLCLFILAFMLIILTPIVADKFAPLFDWAGYGALVDFAGEIITIIVWMLEIIILFVVYLKKFKTNILFVYNKEKKGEVLPAKSVAILSIITVACILLVSIQIEFGVKPFYDMGDKINGYQLMTDLAILGRNLVKCIWIVVMMNAMQIVIESFAGKKISFPLVGVLMMATLGIYDIVMNMNTLPLTYLLFYFVFGWIYLLTERNTIKTFIIVLFIFLF